MTGLLPTLQAREIQQALTDFLRTTFALADAEVQAALETFLTDPAAGLFRGPYLRLRLPFEPAEEGWRQSLDWAPDDFIPHGHQATAFARLSSRTTDGEPRRPQPTLVTTGTGSGKTEAFLYPILDHVLRARRAGISGTKALVLYPMNALANDQAGRLTKLITGDPRLAGVTAALYTGEAGETRTHVTEAGLITDRAIIRNSPPDILLTNYKMLDQLLLRHADHSLWQGSADSLTYLVLDEFHTYDGAQGTDVAMLLRRLGLVLHSYRSAPTPEGSPPLGAITPVATSATLGDGGDPQAMVDFATTVFGEPFDQTCVVRESRVRADAWFTDPVGPSALAPDQVDDHLARLTAASAAGDQQLAATTVAILTGETGEVPGAESELAGILRRARPLQQLVGDGSARHLHDLATALYDSPADERSIRVTAMLVAGLSVLRGRLGRVFLSVEAHLWVRELSRVDRELASLPVFRWSDDGPPAITSQGDGTAPAAPAVYCRHCGRSGWGVQLQPTGHDLNPLDPQAIRRNKAAQEGRFRALLHAPSEAVAGHDVEGLAWLNLREQTLQQRAPALNDPNLLEGHVLPVLTVVEDADKESQKDHCPACDRTDGIRFLGSAIATLLSVSLSALFGSPDVPAADKKSLVFTDSVQDAAHRAGFVESRSHTLTLRSVIRSGLSTEPVSLVDVAERVMQAAGQDAFARYRLLAPDLVGRDYFDRYWAKPDQLGNQTRQAIRRRLLFDVLGEFGVHSRVGRTLEATGAAAAEVDLGPRTRLLTTGRQVLERSGEEQLPGVGEPVADRSVVAWVRGVVEHMRTQGAIEHEWLTSYIDDDGNRYRISGGRPRAQGMPAFPSGRTAPAFPRVGPAVKRKAEMLLDQVTVSQGWYARWTARVLGVEPGHGARLARAMLERLEQEGALQKRSTKTKGTAYALAPTSVTAALVDPERLAAGDHVLRCPVCRTEQPGGLETVQQLDGAPCLLVRCGGTLQREGRSDNFYRRLYASADMRRVVAREHTSLLDDELRLTYENGFKDAVTSPGAPNVLVATPTLEMGIDIGDLSAVMLASLPKTVASYLQRVGRAGRATGNALDLAFAAGRGETLQRLNDPLSIIDGPVRPPAPYLGAEEILRRQYLAHIVDDIARDPSAPHPRHAVAAMATGDGTFLHRLVTEAETRSTELLDRFLSSFPQLDGTVAARLRSWAALDADPASSGLAQHVHNAATRWQSSVQGLAHRRTAIEKALPELEKEAESPAATDDAKRALRAARASLKQTKAALGELRGAHWIAVLEEYGLLPNYTLLDDTVTLDVALSWLDPETQQWDSTPMTHARGSAVALHELAPGAHFYAQGLEIEIDAVDLGTDGQAVVERAFCGACGYSREAGLESSTGACPRCGDASIQDTDQRLEVVEMSRVSAQAHRDDARITDRSDDRRRVRFTVVPTVDVDPSTVGSAWFVEGEGFGVRYLDRVDIRWLNLGPLTGVGMQRSIGGESVAANLFPVCAGCGVLDRAARANRPDEHRAWCRYRKTSEENVRSIALSRTLTSQGALLTLPWSISMGGALAVPSVTAAVLLGLRERFGGSPDHLGIEQTVDPVVGGDNRQALFLHDTVPGGTGYLAQLARPENVWELLKAAWQVVATCPCRDEDREACHRCLLPFAPRGRPETVSRQEAERHLSVLLTLGAAEQDVPEAMPWTCTDEAPVPGDGLESPLELRFRQRFIEVAQGLSGQVSEVPGPGVPAVKVTFPRGRTWLLEAQLNVANSKPDFVLSSTDTQVPKIAIFTDGFAYHASPAHNRLQDDADKRAILSDLGYRVLAVTAADLQASSPGPPAWWRDEVRAVVVRRAPAAVKALEGLPLGPVGMLTAWLQDPDTDSIRALADALPLAFVRPGGVLGADADQDLANLARRLLRGEALSGGSTQAFWWVDGPLGVLVRVVGEQLQTAVVLDDRRAAVQHHDHRRSWQEWLRLSNLFQLGTSAVTNTTMTSDRALVLDPARDAAGELSPEWRDVLDAVDDARVRVLVLDLARREVELPEVGEEVEALGIPTELAWPERRIAVVLDLDAGERVEAAEAGWQLLGPDDDVAVMIGGMS